MGKIVVTNTLGELSTNCYTVYDTDTREAFMIDPCANAPFLIDMVNNQRFKLKAMLLTHGHWDHIGAVPALREAFPEAKLYAAEAEKNVLSDIGKNLSAMFGSPLTLEADEWLREGEHLDLAGLDIECLAVPGHTEGGMCYYIKSENWIFSGDTLFAGSIGRSDFPTGDGELLISKISEKILSLPDETVVYSGHGPRTKVGIEKTENMFF